MTDGLTADETKALAEGATVADPTAIGVEQPEVGEEDLWVVHQDPEPTDEMVLLDFDEEPAVFDEDLEDDADGEDDTDDEDEILDLYGDELDDEDDTADAEEVLEVYSGEELDDEDDSADDTEEVLDAFAGEELDDEDETSDDREEVLDVYAGEELDDDEVDSTDDAEEVLDVYAGEELDDEDDSTDDPEEVLDLYAGEELDDDEDDSADDSEEVLDVYAGEELDDEDESANTEEVLDVYAGEELDDEDETVDDHEEVFDEEDDVLYAEWTEDVDDEVPVEVVAASEGDEPDDERFVDEVVDWILDALEELKLEAVDNDAVQAENVVLDEDDVEDVYDEVPVEVGGALEDQESDYEEIVDTDRKLVDEGAEDRDENQHDDRKGILDAFEEWKLQAADNDAVQAEDLVLDEDDVEDVFDEVPVQVGGALDDQEPDYEDIVDEDRELVDESAGVVEEIEDEGGNGAFDPIEEWNLEGVDVDTAYDEEDPEDFNEDQSDADEFIDVFDEDTDDPVPVPEPVYEQRDARVALLELAVESFEPDRSASSALSSELSVNAGRKKARHKKQSPRQRKRSLRKAEQEARKAEKSSRKAAAKSSETTVLTSFDETNLEAESSPALSA